MPEKIVEKPVSRRRKYTSHTLREALTDRLEEKPLQQITVVELCEWLMSTEPLFTGTTRAWSSCGKSYSIFQEPLQATVCSDDEAALIYSSFCSSICTAWLGWVENDCRISIEHMDQIIFAIIISYYDMLEKILRSEFRFHKVHRMGIFQYFRYTLWQPSGLS